MLVDAVMLRDEGKKLPAAALRAAAPLRGWLVIRTQRTPSGGPPGQDPVVVHAVLVRDPEDTHGAKPGWLSHAMVTALRNGQLVVAGRESYGNPYAHQ